MKKFYLPLLATAVLFSSNFAIAEEPTFSITEDWKTLKEDKTGQNELEGLDRNRNWDKEEVTTKNCVRYATAMNGKFYFVNMKTMSIAEFTQDGEIKDLYKLPALTGDDFYGTAITRDDAGNFLIGHYFTDQKSSYVWTIYNPKNGEYKHFDVTPDKIPAAGRIDCVGRVVGDLTKHAFVYVSSRSWNVATPNLDASDIKILCIEFTNDGADLKDVEATAEFSRQIYISAGYCSIAQPAYSSIEETLDFLDNQGGKLDETFYSYSTAYGSANTLADYWPMFYSKGFTREDATQFESYASTTGFDTFELNGQRFYVINYLSKEAAESADANMLKSTMDVAVYDEKFNKLASWSNPVWKAPSSYTSLIAEPVDDTTANIYSYACAGAYNGQAYGNSAIAAAKLTFTANGLTGIADVAVDNEDAAPVYYNLQGVEVANPENGIYVVRRGSKVTKEVIR